MMKNVLSAILIYLNLVSIEEICLTFSNNLIWIWYGLTITVRSQRKNLVDESILIDFSKNKDPQYKSHDDSADVEFELGPSTDPMAEYEDCEAGQEPEG